MKCSVIRCSALGAVLLGGLLTQSLASADTATHAATDTAAQAATQTATHSTTENAAESAPVAPALGSLPDAALGASVDTAADAGPGISAGAAADAPSEPGDAQAGQALFTRTCGGCHKVGRYARGAFGPQLNGLFGRVAGSTDGYVYSKAMQASGITWQRDTLIAFIKDPSDVVPGTNMHFWGISDPSKLDDLLAWLRANQHAE